MKKTATRRKRRGFSFTFKISLTITLLLTIIMLGMGGLTYFMNQRVFIQQETSQGESIGAFAREMMGPSAIAGDEEEMNKTLDFMKEDPKIVQAYVTNIDGEIIAHPEEANMGNRMQSSALNAAMESGGIQVQRTLSDHAGIPVLLFVVPLEDNLNRPVGYLHFLTDFSPVNVYLWESAIQWIQIFVAVVLVSLVLVRLIIVKAVGKPVKQLLEATEKAAVGDFSQQLEPGARDELGQLAEGFNMMIRQLGVLFRSVNQSVSEVDYASRQIVTRAETMSEADDSWPREKEQEWLREIHSNGKRLVRVSDKMQSFLNQFQVNDELS